MVDWEHEGARWFIVIVYCAVMIPVYFYIVQPVLVDINPIFAYDTEGFRPGPRTLGELMFFVFLIGGWFLYGSIKYMISYSPKVFFANIGITFLIFIPNRLLPEKYYPKNIDLQKLEDRYE